MPDPQIPQRGPFVLDCQPGAHAWCACGRSKKQPFCDGSHAGTCIAPRIEVLESARKVAWCGCKHSKQKPFCDGSHKTLPL
jgi:CDGSH-type Zn-finger protein